MTAEQSTNNKKIRNIIKSILNEDRLMSKKIIALILENVEKADTNAYTLPWRHEYVTYKRSLQRDIFDAIKNHLKIKDNDKYPAFNTISKNLNKLVEQFNIVSNYIYTSNFKYMYYYAISKRCDEVIKLHRIVNLNSLGKNGIKMMLLSD